MSFSAEIGRFLVVAAVYVGFTFLWGWYKGRQETADDDADGEAGATGGGR